MASFSKKSRAPETIVGEEGSAKRNIIRKGGQTKVTRKAASNRKKIDDGSTYENDGPALDEHDPNFDSEEDNGEYAPSLGSLHREDIAKSSMTLTTYKRRIEPPITEFFSSGDFDEIARTIEEMEASEYSYEFVKRIINMSLDKSDKERELVSQLLAALNPDVLSTSMCCKGFERLFEIVDEIDKDVPNARSCISIYLARAVLDEVISPSFLTDSVVCNLGGEIVDQAKMLLSRDHSGARLERSWGPGDGRPVPEMKFAIDQCMQEFIVSGDAIEAERCIRELNAPFFGHEVVKRLVVNALDKDPEKHIEMSRLLHHLVRNEVFSQYQLMKGFEKLSGAIPDLVLDCPSADQIVAGFAERAKADGILTHQ